MRNVFGVMDGRLDPTGCGWDWSCFGTKVKEHSGSILAKLAAAEEPSTNAAIAPIEEALVASSRGKVVPLVTGHGQASVRAGKLGVTPEAARTVGEWMARTSWLKGPVTLLGVLNKWADWYSKATATAPPPAVGPGFTGEDREATEAGPARQGSGSKDQRPAPGFRRGR